VRPELTIFTVANYFAAPYSLDRYPGATGQAECTTFGGVPLDVVVQETRWKRLGQLSAQS
jgi:hypothetical protein